MASSERQQDDGARRTGSRGDLAGAYERIARAVLRSLELPEVVDVLVREVVKAGLFRSMTIALVDKERACVEVQRGAVHTHLRDDQPAAESEIDLRDSYSWARYPLDGENAMAVVARTGESLVIERGDDPRLDRRVDANPGHWHDKVAYFLPVRKGAEVIAVLATASTVARKGEILGRIDTLQPLLDHVAVALEHARMYQGLREANARLAAEIAERERLEAEIVRSQRMSAVADLAAGISHNLNNLLAAMLGSAQLLAGGECGADTRGQARELVATIRRARDLVDRFQTSTRSIREDVEAVDVAAAVRDAVSMTPFLSGVGGPPRGVRIVADLGAVPRARGRAHGLRDVVASLVANGLEAMPQGGEVVVSGRVEGESVILEVRDTGVGMDPETVNRAFEPFFTTKRQVGRGLGLSVAQRMVAGWGGSIGLASAPGQGTTVRLSLRLWKPSAQAGVTGPEG